MMQKLSRPAGSGFCTWSTVLNQEALMISLDSGVGFKEAPGSQQLTTAKAHNELLLVKEMDGSRLEQYKSLMSTEKGVIQITGVINLLVRFKNKS